MGGLQSEYNFLDRVFGQKAMVDKATAEGIAVGIAQERERRKRGKTNP